MIKLYSIEPEAGLTRQREGIIKKFHPILIKPLRALAEPERHLPRTQS
jgi:hypothetical protein